MKAIDLDIEVCLQLLSKILAELKNIQQADNAIEPDLSTRIRELGIKVKELCGEECNSMIDNCYR